MAREDFCEIALLLEARKAQVIPLLDRGAVVGIGEHHTDLFEKTTLDDLRDLGRVFKNL